MNNTAHVYLRNLVITYNTHNNSIINVREITRDTKGAIQKVTTEYMDHTKECEQIFHNMLQKQYTLAYAEKLIQ